MKIDLREDFRIRDLSNSKEEFLTLLWRAVIPRSNVQAGQQRLQKLKSGHFWWSRFAQR